MPWIEAVKAFDADSLSRLLERATVQLGHIGLLHHLIAPLAQRLGDLWIEGSLRTSHEHFATALIRGFLLNPARQYAGASSTPALVAATPQGQLHELGAVMATALAAEQGAPYTSARACPPLRSQEPYSKMTHGSWR